MKYQEAEVLKAYFLWTVFGPQIILTTCDLTKAPGCLSQNGRIVDLWTNKFMAYELPLDAIKERYGTHYDVVVQDPDQKDELRILDSDGHRVLQNIRFKEFGQPIYYEPGSETVESDRDMTQIQS